MTQHLWSYPKQYSEPNWIDPENRPIIQFYIIRDDLNVIVTGLKLL